MSSRLARTRSQFTFCSGLPGRTLSATCMPAMVDGLVETVHYFNGRLEHYGTGPSGLRADDV